MANGASRKNKAVEGLLGDLSIEVESNDDVRRLGHVLAALAAGLGSAILGSKTKKLDLEEVLERIAGKTRDPKTKDELNSLARTAKALTEYSDLASYDDELTDSERESIEKMRQELVDGLWSWWEQP